MREAFPRPNTVTTDPDALKIYGSSEHSYHQASPHAVVVRLMWPFTCSSGHALSQVRPKSTDDVVTVVNIARTYRVPITAYSGATSLEGHFSGVISSPGILDRFSFASSFPQEVYALTCLAWTE